MAMLKDEVIGIGGKWALCDSSLIVALAARAC